MEPTERMKGPTEVNRPAGADEEGADRTLYPPSPGVDGEMVHGGATTGTVPVDDVVGGSVIMEDWGRMPADAAETPPLPGAARADRHDLDTPAGDLEDEPASEGTDAEHVTR